MRYININDWRAEEIFCGGIVSSIDVSYVNVVAFRCIYIYTYIYIYYVYIYTYVYIYICIQYMVRCEINQLSISG